MEEKKNKIIKIAFDLDGVVIDKPPFVPKKLLEWLFRGGKKDIFSCRYPDHKLDQTLRKFSHFYLFRPPLKKNLSFLKKMAENPGNELYIISSRYSFLMKETKSWFKKRKIDGLFKKVFLNEKNLSPHLFKESILRELRPDIFIDDDVLLIQYLQNKQLPIKFFCYSTIKANNKGIKFIKNLKEIFDQ